MTTLRELRELVVLPCRCGAPVVRTEIRWTSVDGHWRPARVVNVCEARCEEEVPLDG